MLQLIDNHGNKEWTSGSPPKEVEIALQRCFALFDTDNDGKLSAEDCERVLGAMGITFLTPQTLMSRYLEDIKRLGGVTYDVFKVCLAKGTGWCWMNRFYAACLMKAA